MTHPRSRRRRFLGQALSLPFGLGPAAAGPQAALPPHHLPDGTFQNPPGSPSRGGGFGEWLGFFWRRLVAGDPPVAVPEGHVLPPEAVAQGLARLESGEGILWLGHASFLIRLAGRTILTDPYLTDYASPFAGFGPRRFTPPGLPPKRLPPADILLLSHNHYDHLDLRALHQLPGLARTVLVTPLGVTRYVDRRRFAAAVELDWHQAIEIRGIMVRAVPAIHFSKRGLFDRNATLWCGFRLETPARTVHFAGDTAYGPVFRELGRRYPGPDLALVPIGAYEPRLLMRGSHCTPEEAVALARDLGAKRLAAMHWGTIRLTDEPPFEPPGRFRQAATAQGYGPETAWLMAIGETRAAG